MLRVWGIAFGYRQPFVRELIHRIRIAHLMIFGVLANPDSWYLRDLQRAATDLGHVAEGLSFRELASFTPREGTTRVRVGSRDLREVDAVIVRSMPPGTLEQVVFRMDALGRHEAQGGLVVNPSKSLEFAIDKYLTTSKLIAAGLPSPQTFVCQDAEAGMEAFERLNRDVVVKPLFGGEGRGILRVDDPDLAFRVFRAIEQMGSVLYIQEFIRHGGFDIRVMLIGEKVFCMKRINSKDWRTNLARGAVTERYEPDGELVELSRRATEALGVWISGVDIVEDENGKRYILEVNAVPGWRGLAKTCGEDIAIDVIEFACRKRTEQSAASV